MSNERRYIAEATRVNMGLNQNVTCEAREDQLIEFGTLVTAPVTNPVVQTIVVPTGRGRVKRIQILALSNVIADLSTRTISVLINGVAVLQQINLTKYSFNFDNITRESRVDWPEQSKIDVQISGGSAVAIPVMVELFFVD
jgi:hypothetical protein